MKFEANILGNRVSIKTIKDKNCKVTYLKIEDAKKTIKNIIENGWTIKINRNLEYIL